MAEAIAAGWLGDARTVAASAPPVANEADARRLAWALKAACHEAWSSQPSVARRAADCVDWLARAHADDPEISALADWTAGLNHLVAGDMQAALDALSSAELGFARMGQALWAAQVGVPQLMALSILGRHDEAIARADALARQLADAGDAHVAAKVALNHGSMLLRLDRHAEAAAAYRRAGVAFAQQGDAEHSIMADIGLATTLAWQDQWDEAEAITHRAHQRARARQLPVLEALALGEWGQLALQRGDRSGALHALRTSRALLGGRAHPQRLLEADRALADACLAIGLLPETCQRYEAVIQAATDLQAPLEAAWAQLHLAHALERLGRPQAATQALAAARAAFDAAGNPVGQARAATLAAQRALALGDAATARAEAQAADAALTEAGLRGWALEASFVAARALARLGRWPEADALATAALAQAEGRPQAPAAALLTAELAQARGLPAEAAYLQALDGFERLRASLPTGELRLAATRDAEQAADALVRLAIDQGDPSLLWQRMEAARSRALHEALAQGDGPPSAHALPGHQLHRRWQWLHLQLARALAQAAPTVAPLRHRIALVEAELREQRRGEALTAPRLGASAVHAATVPLPALRAELGPHRVLVEYHLLDGHQAQACIIGPRGLRTVALDATLLDSLLGLLREQLAALAWPGALGSAHSAQRLARCQAVLHRLHGLLVAPWADELAGCTQCVIVPHRTLHSLPWAALFDGERHWVQQMELVVAPSATAWWHCARRAPTAGAAVLLASGDAALPATTREVQAAATQLGDGALALVGEAATVAALRQQAPVAGVLHLACHASARADAPEFSALHLADGLFTADEAAALRLPASVAVLSACDTALAALAPGDEALGLARGFLLGGARSVLASLWAVPDAPTADFMARLHAADARQPAAALQRAQCEQIDQGAALPNWAAFVCVGSG